MLGFLIKVLAFGRTSVIAQGIAGAVVVGLGIWAWDTADDNAAIKKHEQKKTEHVRKKVTKARRAGRRVRTNADVRRVLENAADRN